jgi:membrane protease YdiL (CAAX protease family)
MEQYKSENRNLWLFFLLAFGISWVVWIPAALASHGFLSLQLSPVFTGLLGAFGPSLAAIILTGVFQGKAGLRSLIGRLFVWRVGIQWYVFVLLWPAVLSLMTSAINFLLGGPAPDFANPPILRFYPLPPEAFAVGLLPLLPFVFLQQMFISSPMGEEIGWRGYALLGLQKTRSALAASVILGILWGVWHLPKFFTQGDPLSETFFGWFILGIVGSTILFTWIYNNTKGSLLLVLLFHTSVNVTGLFLSAAETSPLLELALLWGVVTMVLVIWRPKKLVR